MKWDLGSLRKYPRQSAVFRYMTSPDRPKYSHLWPVEIQQEAAVFTHTQGISKRWLYHVLRIGFLHRKTLGENYPEWVAKAEENMLSATYDDAYWYVRRGLFQTEIPRWAYPFILEDKKNKVPVKDRIANNRKARHFNFLGD